METRVWCRPVEILIVASLTFAVSRGGARADDFELRVEGRPELSSTVQSREESLIITDANQRSFEYRRARQFDSGDGRFEGYYSDEARQAIRWPVSGQGAMLLGGADGINWRESQQQIHPLAVAASDEPTGRGEGAVAILSQQPGVTLAAYVDNEGSIRVYRVSVDARQSVPWNAPAAFPPGGSLVWWRSSADVSPALVSIDQQGRLTRVTSEGELTPLSERQFLPGGDLAVLDHFIVAVDRRGRLIRHDLESDQETILEPRAGFLPPAAAVAVAQAVNQSRPDVFVVDRQGNLLGYQAVPARDSEPVTIATGFAPGTRIAVESRQDESDELRLAAVDWSGQLQLLTAGAGRWRVETPVSTRLAPGSAVALSHTVSGAILMAVDPLGGWQSWFLGPPVVTTTVVGAGFPVGAPIAWDPYSGMALAMDSLGHLAMANLAGNEWVTHLAWTGVDFSPRLLERGIVLNRPLDKVRVTFENTSDDEIILQIVDRLDPRNPPEFQIQANSSIEIELERDSGATLEELYLAPGPGGTLLEESYEYILPPRQRYDIVAWSNRVTYRYIDRRKDKPPGALPNFDVRNHVSLGVLPIPPGDLLQDGAIINIQRAVETLRNPGAAVWYAPPQPSRNRVTTEPPPETP